MLDRARCSNCGTFPDEWLTVDVDEESGEPVDRFVVPPPYEATVRVCGGCEEREKFDASEYDDGKKKRPAGAATVLVPADPQEYPRERHTGPNKLDHVILASRGE